MGFDPRLLDINDILFNDQTKEIDGMPEALGKSVHIICHVDENHVGSLINRR